MRLSLLFSGLSIFLRSISTSNTDILLTMLGFMLYGLRYSHFKVISICEASLTHSFLELWGASSLALRDIAARELHSIIKGFPEISNLIAWLFKYMFAFALHFLYYNPGVPLEPNQISRDYIPSSDGPCRCWDQETAFRKWDCMRSDDRSHGQEFFSQ